MKDVDVVVGVLCACMACFLIGLAVGMWVKF